MKSSHVGVLFATNISPHHSDITSIITSIVRVAGRDSTGKGKRMMTRLIDADEMLKRLESWNTDDEMDKALYNFTLSRIIEQPTVDAVPVRHGRWIGYPECLGYEDAISSEDIVCSACGEVFNIIDNDTERFDYCPHCGAKMGETE